MERRHWKTQNVFCLMAGEMWELWGDTGFGKKWTMMTQDRQWHSWNENPGVCGASSLTPSKLQFQVGKETLKVCQE